MIKSLEFRVWGLGRGVWGLRPCSRANGTVYFTEMCSGSEAGSYLRLIDLCITKCRLESNKEEKAEVYQSRSGFRTWIQAKVVITAELFPPRSAAVTVRV